MIIIDNYSLIYDKKKNRIVICLPQTACTPSDTVSPVENRIVDMPDKDFAPVLLLVKYMFDGTLKTRGSE